MLFRSESVWLLGSPPRSRPSGVFVSETWVTFAQGASICCFPLPALWVKEYWAFMYLMLSSSWRLGKSLNAHLWPLVLSTRAAFGPRSLVLHPHNLRRLHLHRLRLRPHHLPRTFFPPYVLFSAPLTCIQPEECWNPIRPFRSGLLGDTAPPW